MSRIKRFVLSVLLSGVLLISSCSNAGTVTPTKVTTMESVATSTIIPESTPTPISLPTDTQPAPTPLPLIKTQCVGNSASTQKLDLDGVVALNKAAKVDGFEFGFFLLNLNNGNTVRDVKEALFRQVSLDRKFLVYEYLKDNIGSLSVLDSNGQTISDFEPGSGKLRVDFFNWQNPDQLRILHQGNGNNLSVELLNPFTQERAPLRTDWSGVYTPKNVYQDKLVQWQFDQFVTRVNYVYGANILYDPTLTRVLYPKDNGVVSLADVQNETELASAQFEDWGKLPSWSPDGEHLSIVNHEENADEFYLISRDGNEFQKITNLANELNFVSISESVWSPDSKQIAFWLNTETGERESGAQSELTILDVEARQVTRLCFQGISVFAAKPWLMGHPEPIWSPDGRYIMITRWDDPADPKKYYVLVIDPETGAVQKISENTAPIGWMVSEP